MGDFSIRCSISGVPIPCGTPVLVIAMGIGTNSRYRYAMGLPVAGEMGAYGEVETGITYDPKGHYLHVLPDLWRAAGTIWETEMSTHNVPGFMAEIVAAREQYRASVRAYAAFKDSEHYAALIARCVFSGADGPWLRRLSHVLLFAPDFGEGSALRTLVSGWITQDVAPEADAVLVLRQTLAAFMSGGVTGVDLLGPETAHPMQQYPDLKCDLAWHTAIVTAIKRMRVKR